MKTYTLLFFIFSIIFSCNTTGKKDADLLPIAKGKGGEIILVMDSAKWEGPLGNEIRNVFRPQVEGLPRPEALFSVRYIDPRKLNSVLKQVTNMIFVTTLDGKSKSSRIINNYFTKESRQKIKDNDHLFLFTDNNLFAKGQEVMYLFGQNEKQLIEHLKENKVKLQNHFNSIEESRLKKNLYKAKEVKGINKMLATKHNCSLRIPAGYQLVQQKEGFIWVRRIETKIDKNIFIAYRDFDNEKIFEKENIKKLRKEITSTYLFDDPADPSTFVTTQDYDSLLYGEVNFQNKYAVRIKGLWKTNNNSMGGPFLSYTFVDEALNRLYYIEGFVYSPGKSQRELMREIAVILSTFKTSKEI